MASVTVYGNEACAYCGAARMLLKRKGIEFEDVSVTNDAAMRSRMETLSGRTSVPQIFIGDTHVGGFDDLCELDASGELDRMLGR